MAKRDKRKDEISFVGSGGCSRSSVVQSLSQKKFMVRMYNLIQLAAASIICAVIVIFSGLLSFFDSLAEYQPIPTEFSWYSLALVVSLATSVVAIAKLEQLKDEDAVGVTLHEKMLASVTQPHN